MSRPTVLSTLTLLTLVAAGLAATAQAADWPRYRGPTADGTSDETGLLASWPDDGPKELWRTELGDGYSGIAIADGRAVTLYADGKDEFAVALDAATGRQLWHVRIDRNRRDGQGDGPRSTPTVDGETTYVLSSSGSLHALAVNDGSRRWSLDLVDELGARVPQWGVSTSPIVEGDLLIVDVGGNPGYSLVAFDKATGAVRWHSNTDKPGYSTPLAVTIDGRRQIVSFSGTQVFGVDAGDGELLWSHPWSTAYDVNAAMPVFLPPNRIFISSSYDTGAALLQIDGDRALQMWRTRRMKNHFNSSVLVDGFLYGFDDGTLKCLEAASGEERWGKRGFSKGSLIYADGRLIVLGERGTLALVDADPEQYTERARTQLFRSKTWTMPSLADGRLFVRDQSELVALEMAGS